MGEMLPNTKIVLPEERVHFKCVGCGQCCRNVYQQVPIEPLDAFRMAKYLRSQREDITCTDDFLARYAEAVPLDECGYFFFFLKTKGDDNACIFLENNRCKIHAANPRACRTYPFLAGLNDNGCVEYWVSYERIHHFKGPMVTPKSWMKTRFTNADQDFLKADYGAAREISMLLRRVPESERGRAVMYFLMCKYSDYDLDKPFQLQFERNQTKLLGFLRGLSKQ